MVTLIVNRSLVAVEARKWRNGSLPSVLLAVVDHDPLTHRAVLYGDKRSVESDGSGRIGRVTSGV